MNKKRRHNIRLIKKGISYSVQDIAELFKIHPNTIRRWFKIGLMRIDEKEPYLVHGSALYDFLKSQQSGQRHKCNPAQFYCCKCKLPREAHENIVTIKIMNQKQLQIFGRCIYCNTKVIRVGSVKRIREYQEIFQVSKIQDQHIIGTATPSSNCYITMEENNGTI